MVQTTKSKIDSRKTTVYLRLKFHRSRDITELTVIPEVIKYSFEAELKGSGLFLFEGRRNILVSGIYFVGISNAPFPWSKLQNQKLIAVKQSFTCV